MRYVCVFCGSSPGADPVYRRVARELGEALVQRGLGLVFGGGRVGLMGEIADAVLAAGGDAIGVIPRALMLRELGHTGLKDLRVVETMHERKALMAQLSEAFIALPGGLGTIEEFIEAVTWAQLGIHRKPCGLLDARGYYTGLVEFLNHATREQFINPESRALLLIDETPDGLLQKIETFVPPEFDKALWALERIR